MHSLQPKLVLMPGMDGTGELFANFRQALPDGVQTEIVRYPKHLPLSYPDLLPYIASAVAGSVTFVLVAESFSTPLAIQFAAKNPPNLRGLILVSGFASSPVKGSLRLLGQLLAPVLFRMPMPDAAVRFLLLGAGATRSRVAAVRAAIDSVSASVLSARFSAVLACDAREELAQVRVPILCLRAEYDRLVGVSCMAGIKKIQPQAKGIVVNGPHLILQSEPESTANVIAEFVENLSKQP